MNKINVSQLQMSAFVVDFWLITVLIASTKSGTNNKSGREEEQTDYLICLALIHCEKLYI